MTFSTSVLMDAATARVGWGPGRARSSAAVIRKGHVDAHRDRDGRLAALMRRTADSDRDAFAQLFDELAPHVLALIRRVLVDAAQSEEVLQDVFLELWQTAPRFDAVRGTVVAFVMTLAHRRAVDRVRASQAAHERDLKAGIRDLATPEAGPEETVELQLEHERVTSALDRLSPLQREAITLSYYAGLTHAEIASRLDVPLGTVKTRVRDAMIRLRAELGV
jgi:RNA polymerase sigma-70 factor, ECF subfamily